MSDAWRVVDVPADHPAFAGHFPDRPLLPGVLLLAEVMEAVAADPALRARVGAAPRLSVAKFLAPVLPGSTLTIRFAPVVEAAGVVFEVFDGERRCASGQFARAATAADAAPA
ncbi:MAG: 3-hydroxyacyl-ACP dehydratase [Caldimonas sp.]